jgi:hypothetical protein
MSDTNNTHNGQYSIKVRVGNAEIEISAPNQEFVQQECSSLIEQLKLGAAVIAPIAETPSGEVTPPASNSTRPERPETLAEFYKRFTPQTNLDKILIFGHWFDKQGQQRFTPDDIEAKFKEIREKPPAYLIRDLRSLVSKGFLMPPEKAEDGNQAYSLSRSGIAEVESKMSKG